MDDSVERIAEQMIAAADAQAVTVRDRWFMAVARLGSAEERAEDSSHDAADEYRELEAFLVENRNILEHQPEWSVYYRNLRMDPPPHIRQ